MSAEIETLIWIKQHCPEYLENAFESCSLFNIDFSPTTPRRVKFL